MNQLGRVRSEWWFFLALAGQGSILALTEAGKSVRYQHFFPVWEGVSVTQAVLVAALVLQTVLVWALMFRGRKEWIPSAVAVAPRWAWFMLGLAAIGLSATLSRSPVTFVLELAVAGVFALTQILTMVLWALSVPQDTVARVTATWERWSARHGSVLLVAGASVLLAALLSIVAYERHPHVPDEVSYLLGARTWANGMWWMPLMNASEAFSVDLMMYEADRWFAPVPPGWLAPLAVGWWAGVPWLVNPVLSGVNVLLAFFIGLHLYGRRLGVFMAVLVAVSPWHLFLAMSFMTHTFTLTCALVATGAAIQWRRTGVWWWTLVSGAGMGVVGWVRPLEGLIVAMTIGLATLSLRPRGQAFIAVTLMAISSAVVGAAQLWYNRLMTGNVGRFPIMEYTDRIFGQRGYSNALGFGADRGLGWPGLDPLQGHGLPDIFINLNLNLFQVNTELLGWMGGSLLFVLVFLLLRGRGNAADLGMILGVVTVIGIHSFYWFAGGPDFGARYWFLLLLPLVALAARGVEALQDRTAADDRLRGRAGVLVAGLIAASLLVFVPWRAVDKYYGYRGMRPGVMEALNGQADSGLVFVNRRRHPDYHSAVLENPIVLQDDRPIFVWAPTREVAEQALNAYPGRLIWIVDGPSVTGRRFAVRVGPMTPDEFRAVGLRVLGFRD